MVLFNLFVFFKKPFSTSLFNLTKLKNWLVTYTMLFFLSAESQTKPLEYTQNWVNEKNGLMQQNVLFALPDNYGFIWIGTNLGLYKYDGLKATKIKSSVYSKGKIDKYIIHLAKEFRSEKIFGELDPGNNLFSINRDKITILKKNERSIFTFNHHYLTPSNPIIKKANQNSLYKDIVDEFYQRKFQTACVTDNFFYLPTLSKVFIFNKNGTINKIKLSIDDKKNHRLLQFGDSILSIENKKISLIVNSSLSSLKVKFDKKINELFNNKSTTLSNYKIFGDYTNRYYLNCDGKIYEINYKNNILKTTFLFDSPANDIKNIIYYKKIQSYIISTETKGFVILTPKKFQTLSFDDAKYNQILNYNYSVVPINNNFWFSSSGWTYNYITNTYKTDDYYFNDMNYRSLLSYKNNFFCYKYGNFNNVISKKKDYSFIMNKTIQNDIKQFVCSFSHNNNLWISSDRMLYYLKNNQLIRDSYFNFQIPKIFSIKSIDTSNLIIATESGVYNYNTKKKELNIIPKLENVFARYIKQIANNTFWIGCYGDGLFLVKNNLAFKVVDKNIELNTAHAIEEDLNGNLWITTNNGLLTINNKLLIRNTLNHKAVECYRFSTDDGIVTNEFNGGSTHPSLHTNDGIIGFPSMKGFVWFNPDFVNKHQFNGIITIDKVKVNNNKDIPLHKNSYFIPSDSDIISINFGYGYYFNRENLTISYRFDDQKEWTEVKGNLIQIGRYKKGKHKFLIRINTHGFNAKFGITKSLELNFEPKYYETYLYMGLLIVAFIFTLIITYRISIFFSKKREAYLKEKIKEQTSELELSIIDLQQSKESLDKSLQVKNILLKEIHHRVKNNLQLVMSILNIQASDKENTSIEGFIEKGQSRITSMVLIHENLYQKEDIGNINFETYTESLVKNIRTTFGETSDRIDVHIKMKNVFFNVQTSIPLGLIINELVTNSFKHGFPNEKSGLITISIEQINNTNYKLAIEDTGIGFPKDKEDKKSIGLELVSLLVLQLKGKLTIDSKNGTVFEILFATP